MKHAGPEALASIAALLNQLRAIPGLVERKTGVFYWKSRAFLHFHEDPAGVFADVRLRGPDFDRLPATTPGQQQSILEAVRRVVDG